MQRFLIVAAIAAASVTTARAAEPTAKEWIEYAKYSQQQRSAILASHSVVKGGDAASRRARPQSGRRSRAQATPAAAVAELKKIDQPYLANMPPGKPRAGTIGVPRHATCKVIQNLGDGSAIVTFFYPVNRITPPRSYGGGGSLDARTAAGQAQLRANVGQVAYVDLQEVTALLKSEALADVPDEGDVELEGVHWFSGTHHYATAGGSTKTILVLEPARLPDELTARFTRAPELREWIDRNDKPIGLAVINAFDGKVVELADATGKPRRIQLKALAPECQKVAFAWLEKGREVATRPRTP